MSEDLERVWLSVCVSSLWDACREKYGKHARINFEVLKNIVPCLRGGIDKVDLNAVAYIVTHKRATHSSFSDVLTSLEFQVRTTEVSYVSHNKRPVGVHDDWTAGIAVDAVHWVDSYDTFVLAAGAKQFEKLLKYLTLRGKEVIVLTFETEASRAIYEDCANEVLYLTKDIVYK
jgi:hypothetical protein